MPFTWRIWCFWTSTDSSFISLATGVCECFCLLFDLAVCVSQWVENSVSWTVAIAKYILRMEMIYTRLEILSVTWQQDNTRMEISKVNCIQHSASMEGCESNRGGLHSEQSKKLRLKQIALTFLPKKPTSLGFTPVIDPRSPLVDAVVKLT